MRNNLFALYRANAKRGEFRAEATSNTIYLFDMIVSSKADAEWMGGCDAETFALNLGAMQGDVTVRINSPGGDVFAGIAMANAIVAYPGKVTCIVEGFAASAASLVAVSGDRIEMAESAMLMIHNAWTIAMGDKAEFRAQAEVLEKIDGQLAARYAIASFKRMTTGATDAAAFAAAMDAESWLTADEALAFGLSDGTAAAPVKNAVAWDLSAYARPPVQDTSVTITIEIEDDAAEAAEDPAMEPSEAASTEIEHRQRTAQLALLNIAA